MLVYQFSEKLVVQWLVKIGKKIMHKQKGSNYARVPSSTSKQPSRELKFSLMNVYGFLSWLVTNTQLSMFLFVVMLCKSDF